MITNLTLRVNTADGYETISWIGCWRVGCAKDMTIIGSGQALYGLKGAQGVNVPERLPPGDAVAALDLANPEATLVGEDAIHM